MIVYVKSGSQHYGKAPVPVNSRRRAWEFSACTKGSMAPLLPAHLPVEDLRSRTLWVFPKGFPHGWTSDRKLERIVFHFTVVPSELERMVPHCGYYRVALTENDCARLRILADTASDITAHPTELLSLQSHAILNETSLLALREVRARPLSADTIAHDKTERAIAWYRENMAERPSFADIARAVYVSPAHLRRLFHRARNESPHEAFNRLRMEAADDLLQDPRLTLDDIAATVGLSSASALSRAVKVHFGMPPTSVRKRER